MSCAMCYHSENFDLETSSFVGRSRKTALLTGTGARGYVYKELGEENDFQLFISIRVIQGGNKLREGPRPPRFGGAHAKIPTYLTLSFCIAFILYTRYAGRL